MSTLRRAASYGIITSKGPNRVGGDAKPKKKVLPESYDSVEEASDAASLLAEKHPGLRVYVYRLLEGLESMCVTERVVY